ncbi:Ribonuclease H [Seminavis robusta]|uniref:Ribonuclease H n=1 Tax=Seminavis robusta TaxID=568900 RepID=A0A9N8HKP3_9STRA|nr:Ribonuclease H [Seminavis robusta]|eukprot:Sro626_g177810.1 Ribonuclease H (520) ;mRNA; f:44326-45885
MIRLRPSSALTLQHHVRRKWWSTLHAARWSTQEMTTYEPLLIPSSYRIINLSTAAQDIADEMADALTRTAIRRMRLSQLREELRHRGVCQEGKRDELMQRLLDNLEQEKSNNHHPTVHSSEVSISLPKMNPLQDMDTESETPIRELSSDDDDDTLQIPTMQQLYTADEQERGDDNERPFSIDPGWTYLIRVNCAHAGGTRVVEGSGVGMTLLQVDPDAADAVLQTNQILLPGSGRTPFEADYCALIMAMRHAKDCGIRHLIVEMDALGVVRQVTGQGTLGSKGYQQELHQKVLELKQSFDTCEIVHHGEGHKKKRRRDAPKDANRILAMSALAQQRELQSSSDWAMMEDPLTNMEATAKSNSNNNNQHKYNIDPDREYLLQFDGGARGNPVGVAGIGMVIFDDTTNKDTEVWVGWDFLGSDVTNNVAEYKSLIAGLECALQLGIRKIRAEGDSQLVARQVTGQYKVKKDWLKPLCARVKELSQQFDTFSIHSVPRAANKRADYLANHAMDTGTGNKECV